ncbi:hypothetical protein [Magnetospirillum molischianum]|uniref:Uncharacterized protein n=1 Tax=Magnetospirillum molischianum DSM 120 TaxID=1150626 RepID=H8FV12_MAGML|nr:hypothetical protein [Magnetospirillum molischianum]CCG42200.1 exported hypothetical protein [Magnetospirillum molischianum DSM 120]
MDIDLVTILTALGVSPQVAALAVPGVIAVASALDAAIPQPATGSLWIWPRRLLSWLAINVGHARNAATRAGRGGAVALVLTVLAAGSLSACAGTGQTGGTEWSAAQTAYVEIKTVIAVERVVAKTAATPGLSEAVRADIRAGALALASGVRSQIEVLTAGGDVGDQAKSAAIAAVSNLISQIVPLLDAAHGSDVEPEVALIAAGGGALQSLPAVIGAVVAVNGGYDPPPEALAAALAELATVADSVGAL